MRRTQEYRVLLVDDDPDVLYLLRERLAAADPSFEVLTETDPVAARERFERDERLDCVVSDYAMPGMTGIELLQAVRDRDPELPFVLLTAQGSEEVASEAINAGVTRYLTKDDGVAGTSLADAIADVVERHGERQFLRDRLGLLDVAIGAIDDVVVVLDRDCHPVYWNDTANTTLGYADEELQSMTAFDFFPETDQAAVEQTLQHVVENGRGRLTADLLTTDGERIPYEFTGVALRDDDGDVVGICGIGRDVAERVAYERTLEELHRTMRRLMTATEYEEIATLVADATGHIVDNPVSAVFLHDDGRLVPGAVTEASQSAMDDPGAYDVEEEYPIPRAFRTGEAVAVDVQDIDDERDRGSIDRTLVVPLGDYGVLVLGRTEGAGFSRGGRHLVDVLAAGATAALSRCDRETLLAEREGMLTTLHEGARRFIQTETASAVADVTVETAATLDASLVCVYRWNGSEGTLRPAAVAPSTRREHGDLPTVEPGEGLVWRAFEEDEPVYVDGPTRLAGEDAPALESGVAATIGAFGVLVVASAEERAFDETDVEFVDLLASNARIAFGHIEHEQALLEQEGRLEAQNERLRRLNRINSVIRSINTALVQANSHEEIQRAVCENITDADHYVFAWLGHDDGDGLAVDAWAGTGRSFLDVVRDRYGRTPPETLAERVLETGETSVVADVIGDDAAAPWRKAALARGFQSAVCLPLSYDVHDYGFLEVYADRTDVFTDEEVTVLSELSDDVANAMHAVGRKVALGSGQTTELTFDLGDADGPLFHLVRRLDGRLEVDTLHSTGGSWQVFASVRGADADGAVDVATDLVAVEDASVVRSGRNRALVRLVVDHLPVVDTLADHGATVTSLRVDPDGGRVTVIVSPSTDVRSFVEACRSALDGVELVRRKPATSRASHEYGLHGALTPRQLEVLQTAYFQGYFEWPRAHTGEEVAETMDISGPTFQQHVRKGLQRLFADAFENGDQR